VLGVGSARWFARTPLLLAFAGSLLAIVFYGASGALAELTHLPPVHLVVRLAPPQWRSATLVLLHETGDVLRRWLIGQGIVMAVIGGFTYVGLLILGVPIPFLLALFAGLAGFLPYLGPIIGAIPMVLVAGGEGLNLALWMVGLYALVQFMGSYLLTPLIQTRAVALPPAVVILSHTARSLCGRSSPSAGARS
jgi:predicted PurR-regulated permease PerM